MYSLSQLLDYSAQRAPEKEAVRVPGSSSLTYAELAALSDQVRDRLWHLGVRPGDRVGLRLHKTLDAVVAIFGILKAGAAYVPVDAESPAARGAYILNDCAVKAVFTERALAASLTEELANKGAAPEILAFEPAPGAAGLRALLDERQAVDPAPPVPSAVRGSDDIAYILYTSGSTGNPKGVVLSHGNAASFIDWCSDTFEPTESDVFSSHAPFHFDLSILDIYVPMKHGATLVLFGEELGKDPVRLASTIASERISMWYSTPSILNFLALYGRLDRYDYSALRMVFFAGEVFPIPQFTVLRALWPAPRYFNLYGPTETNVCTFYEVPADDSWKAMSTFPIGRMCEPNQGLVVDEHERPVRPGEPGELLVAGPNVMQGYWNLPDQNARAFFVDGGRHWYRTGDIVSEDEVAVYRYLGRRDRMVKRRGYRVELGEIEAALARHADIKEVAVVSIPDPESGVRIQAFVSCADGRTLSIIGLKSISSKSLPPYMIPDAFRIVDSLPRTSTNKVDLQALRAQTS